MEDVIAFVKEIFSPRYFKWFSIIYALIAVFLGWKVWKGNIEIMKRPEKGDEWFIITGIIAVWKSIFKKNN